MEGEGEVDTQTMLSVEPSLQFKKVSFTTDSVTSSSYRSFIQMLRSQLSSGEKVTSYQYPLLLKAADTNDNNKYLLVKLNHNEKRITIAINVVDLYVIAYKTGSLSFFFEEAPPDAERLLFRKTKPERMSFSTNYRNFQERDMVSLGRKELQDAIDHLYSYKGGKYTDVWKNSLLVVIEMVAESTRYQFIMNYIVGNFYDGYTPKPDTITYENEWTVLSREIQLSNKNGNFQNPVQVNDKENKEKYLRCVSDVGEDIAILKYYDKTGENFENIDEE